MTCILRTLYHFWYDTGIVKASTGTKMVILEYDLLFVKWYLETLGKNVFSKSLRKVYIFIIKYHLISWHQLQWLSACNAMVVHVCSLNVYTLISMVTTNKPCVYISPPNVFWNLSKSFQKFIHLEEKNIFLSPNHGILTEGEG